MPRALLDPRGLARCAHLHWGYAHYLQGGRMYEQMNKSNYTHKPCTYERANELGWLGTCVQNKELTWRGTYLPTNEQTKEQTEIITQKHKETHHYSFKVDKV